MYRQGNVNFFSKNTDISHSSEAGKQINKTNARQSFYKHNALGFDTRTIETQFTPKTPPQGGNTGETLFLFTTAIFAL